MFYMIAEHYEADFHRIDHAVREDHPRLRAWPRRALPPAPALVKNTRRLGAFNPGPPQPGRAPPEVTEGLPSFSLSRSSISPTRSTLPRFRTHPLDTWPWISSWLGSPTETSTAIFDF